MSILFMDNFQSYGQIATIDRAMEGVYAQTANDAAFDVDPDGTSTGMVLELADSATEFVRKVLPQSSQTTVGIHCRVWVDELPSFASKRLIEWKDIDNQLQIAINVLTTGALQLWRGGTLLATTSQPVITAGAWWHFEGKVEFSQTAGTFELRVNEIEVEDLTFSGDTCATALAECSQIVLTNGNNYTVYFKDLIIWNGDGDYNNDFMGDCEVVTLRPNADDTYSGWTSSTGSTGYNLIDDLSPNDADYISASDSLPAAVVFALTNLDPDVTEVLGLQTQVRMKKTDSGTCSAQIGLVHSASTDNGDVHAVTVAAQYWMDICEENPSTSSAWTPAEVDAAKLKINRTA